MPSRSIIFLSLGKVTFFDVCLTQFSTALLAEVSSSFAQGKGNRKVVWQEDFNCAQPDAGKWDIQVDCNGGGNNELQCYTRRPKNVKCHQGKLIITAKPEDYQNKKFTSARLHGKQGWKYGYFEARAKLPKGKHLWPAIWMMPHASKYGIWPRSGEIDIMEYREQELTKIESTLHYGAAWNDKGQTGSGMREFGIDFSQDFHLFGFEWTDKKMVWYLDNKPYFETSLDRMFNPPSGTKVYDKKGSPFDEPFHWILNLAVGGGFFPPEKYGNITPEEAKSWPQPVIEIDYLKVYQ